MQLLPENQCRRCGHMHEETFQLVDAGNRWALCTVHCTCGHHWTVVYTAPANLPVLRTWLARGCEPLDGPAIATDGGTWRSYRFEGVAPVHLVAS